MRMPISSASANGSGGGTPPEQSASSIVGKTASGSHTLTIDGYSQIKAGHYLGRKSIRSAAFAVGGHTWYTQLLHPTAGHRAGWTILLLRLRCTCTRCSGGGDGYGEEVTASYTFSLLDHNGQPSYIEYSGSKVSKFNQMMAFGVPVAESRTANYLRDGDRLRIRCDVTVYLEPRCEDRDVPSRLVAVPPSDIGDHLGRLLSSGVGADLTFEVAGETFAVHRHILAARSPKLLEEILSAGGMKITEEPGVFKALLHYIYTDSLPEIDDGETMDMVPHLIAAGDRYSLDRLKLICEDMLWRRVDTSTVAATLALAEEYNCHGLKKACVQFLMSGSNLKAAMAADGFEHLRNSCPSIVKELLAMVDGG